MAERIEIPPTLQGDEKEQLQQIWRYLYQLSEAINNNLEGIGGNELSDKEIMTMKKIVGAGEAATGMSDVETLKSLIVKTAEFVQTSLQEYKTSMIWESLESGKFGQYVRGTKINVAVTPDGVIRDFTLEEIIQGMKENAIDTKNYIKTGVLREENNLPVYGVAIGKDIVTFANDGTETYHDENKVAEMTAEGLSFWQNEKKIAAYTEDRISFFYDGAEVFYILQGKLYAAEDMEITDGKKIVIASGAVIEVSDEGSITVDHGGIVTFKDENEDEVVILSDTGIEIDHGGDLTVKGGGSMTVESGGSVTFKDANDDEVITLSDTGVEIEHGGEMKVKDANGDEAVKISDTGMELKYGGYIHIEDSMLEESGLTFETDHTEFGKTVTSFESEDHSSVSEYPKLSLVTKFEQDPLDPDLSLQDLFFSFQEMSGDLQKIHFYNQWNGKPNIYCEQITSLLVASYIGGKLGISGGGEWDIEGNDITYNTLTQQSSREVKHDIQKMESCGDRLDRLEPVTFIYNRDKEGKRRAGLIYEDTMKIIPEICIVTEKTKAINYVELIPMLLKEIQDLRARVKTLEER